MLVGPEQCGLADSWDSPEVKKKAWTKMNKSSRPRNRLPGNTELHKNLEITVAAKLAAVGTVTHIICSSKCQFLTRNCG